MKMDERDAIVSPTWPVDVVSWWNNRSGGGHCSRIYAIQTLLGRRFEDAERSFYSLFMLCSYKVKGRGGERAQEKDIFVRILFVFSVCILLPGFCSPHQWMNTSSSADFFEKKGKGRRGRRVLAPGSICSRRTVPQKSGNLFSKNSNCFWKKH